MKFGCKIRSDQIISIFGNLKNYNLYFLNVIIYVSICMPVHLKSPCNLTIDEIQNRVLLGKRMDDFLPFSGNHNKLSS